MKLQKTIDTNKVLRALAKRLAVAEMALENSNLPVDPATWEARIAELKECIKTVEYIAKVPSKGGA